MYYHFQIFKEEKAYWAKCIELEGCQSQGYTKEELYRNLEEALNLYLDEPSKSSIIFPLPDKNLKGEGIIEVKVDERIAFANVLRMMRLNHNMTQKETAEKL